MTVATIPKFISQKPLSYTTHHHLCSPPPCRQTQDRLFDNLERMASVPHAGVNERTIWRGVPEGHTRQVAGGPKNTENLWLRGKGHEN